MSNYFQDWNEETIKDYYKRTKQGNKHDLKSNTINLSTKEEKSKYEVNNTSSDNKYHNKKIEVEGILFDSQKEANRFIELRYLEQAGEIHRLKMQVPYELQPSFEINSKKIRAILYIADFVYYDKNDNLVVEDCKGFKTDVYKIKKKMFEYRYQVELREV